MALARVDLLKHAIAKLDAAALFTGDMLTEYETQVQTSDGRWWVVRIAPLEPNEGGNT